MPIYKLTYEDFHGKRSRVPAWFPIVENTIKLAFRNRILFWSYMACAAPPLIAIVMLYVRYQIESISQGRGGGAVMSQFSFDARHYYGFLNFQGGLSMIVSGIVGCAAIGNDRRGNALEAIFSRSITLRTYLFGRWLGIFILVLSASLIPAFIIWYFDNALSTDPQRLLITLHLPARFAVWSLIHSTSVSLIVLAFSSLITRGWVALAGFAGFVMIGGGFFAAVSAPIERVNETAAAVVRSFGYFPALSTLQAVCFGGRAEHVPMMAEPVSSGIFVGVLALLSIFILCLRVRPIEVVS